MSNPVKQKLSKGQSCLGTFVFEFDSTGIARLAAGAGAEFVVFDMEHTGWSVETIRTLIATTPREQIVPAVRVPATEYDFMASVLDVGARGVMVPMVETVAQAEQIVRACKYPPVGRRGAAFGVAHDDYSTGDVAAKIEKANQDTLLIAQIETATGVENAAAIAAVPGIDVLWIGHFDLTNSLGIPGQFDNPTFLDAVQQVLSATQQHQRAAGFMVATVEEARSRLEQGFRCLAYQGDLWLYQTALRDGLTAIRAGG